jgi:hypothetical protein
MDKQCNKCGIIKDIEDFYKSQRGSKCKKCTLEETREYKRLKRKDSDYKKKESSKQKERRVRLWQNTLINDSKHRGLENTLTIEDITSMYEEQGGLCYWFKIPLEPSKNTKHPQQPSLDRLDRNRGYTKDNVVLCCYCANIGRNENDLDTWKTFLGLLLN